MSLVAAKRISYVLRKAFLLPVGLIICIGGAIATVYFYPEMERAGVVISSGSNDIHNQADAILQQNQNWPMPIREMLLQLKSDVTKGNWNNTTITTQQLRDTKEGKGKRDVFLLRYSAVLLQEAATYYNELQRYFLVGVGIIVFGIVVAGIGATKAKKFGKYVTSEQLMGNIKKFEMPEFPSKDIFKKAHVQMLRIFIVVNKFGHVIDLDLLEGPRVLLPYIVKAARKWKFDPFIYKGKDVNVIGEIKINIK